MKKTRCYNQKLILYLEF